MAYKFQLGPAILSGALEQQGTMQANDAATLQSDLSVGGDATFDNNVTLGSSVSDNVEFKATVSSSIEPAAAGEHDIGRAGREWRRGYFEELYADTSISGAQLQGPLQYSASADAQGGIQGFDFNNNANATVALKNYNSFSGDQVLRWDGVGYRFVDSSIADDGASVGIDADTSITGTLAVASAANLASTLDVAGVMSGASDLLIGGQFDLEGDARIEGKVVTDHVSASAESEMADIMPAANLSHDLGSSTLEWRDVYARTFRASLRVSASSYRGQLENSASADAQGGIQAFTFDNTADATVALKNYGNFSDTAIMVWDGPNYQFRDSSIKDDATSVSINADTSVTGTLAVSDAVDLASTLDVAGVMSGASDLQIGGNADIDGNFSADGNLTLGSGIATSEVEFQAAVSSSIVPSADGAFDLGDASFHWDTLYVRNIEGADIKLDVDTGTSFGNGVDVLLANGAVTLPACDTGKIIRVKNVASPAAAITLTADTGDTIEDGLSTSIDLETQGAAVSLIGSGSNWYVF